MRYGRRKRTAPVRPDRAELRFARSGSAILALLVLGACGAPPPAPPPDFTPVPDPDPEGVDAVLFLTGDAGMAEPGHSPVVAHLEGEVRRWSVALGRDSAVSAVFLGDNVYPSGVHARSHDDFSTDSLRLWSQVGVLAQPEARRTSTTGYFLAGNHDWGNTSGDEGLERVRNQERLLRDLRAETGAVVELIPPAGDPGPTVVDLGRTSRLVFIDTHWWLQSRDTVRAAKLLEGVERALAEAGGRSVVVAAHHPFASGGVHAGPVSVWRGLGILTLLRRSGALIQDLNSAPYRELVAGMRAVFGETGRPLVFAGGHDHSLQVIEGSSLDEPRWSLVSGSGSKLTGVRAGPGMLLGAEQPGYMRLTFLRDGTVLLHVLATDGPQRCEEGTVDEVRACMARGLHGFRSIFSMRLR